MSEMPEDVTEAPTTPVGGPPTVDVVFDYLDTPGTQLPDPDQIEQAYAAEKAAQRSVCKVPADDVEWPADLAEALCRRVAVNLAVRKNPLSIETAQSEFGTSMFRVGGRDAEVRRLESPYRKRVVG